MFLPDCYSSCENIGETRHSASSARSTRLVLPLTVLLLCFTTTASAHKNREHLSHSGSAPVGISSPFLSLPQEREGRSLFPSAISGTFVYVQRLPGAGHIAEWFRILAEICRSGDCAVQGEVIFKDTIQVQAGWNIIGSLSQAFARASIQTWPPGIITGQIFQYTPGVGYQPADTLRPGLGTGSSPPNTAS